MGIPWTSRRLIMMILMMILMMMIIVVLFILMMFVLIMMRRADQIRYTLGPLEILPSDYDFDDFDDDFDDDSDNDMMMRIALIRLEEEFSGAWNQWIVVTMQEKSM